MIVKAVVFIALCIAAAVLVPLYRRRHLLEHSLLEGTTPTGEFQGLHHYIDAEDPLAGEIFWALSQGLTGLYRRFCRMVLIVRDLQHKVRAGHITREDAQDVWAYATKQVWFTALAIPEAAFCAIWRDLPHACGLFALRYHYQLTVEAFTVCSSEDAAGNCYGLL